MESSQFPQVLGLANFTALQPFISQVGADTVITLNGADMLTLKSINAALHGRACVQE